MTDAPTMAPIHPGEILRVEYLEPFGVTQHRLAVAIGVPPRRINEIVHATTATSRFGSAIERWWQSGVGRLPRSGVVAPPSPPSATMCTHGADRSTRTAAERQ